MNEHQEGEKEVVETFHWEETADVLGVLKQEPRLQLDDKRTRFLSDRIEIRPPLVLPIGESETLDDYLTALPFEPTLHTVILMQAGAAALATFDEDEPQRTKAIKKYVVRGRGKAQPTHLSTKGKSRYGSRLRLQNARSLLVEINEKLCEWHDELGPPDHIFVNCPVRMWPGLFLAKVPPPFSADDPIIRIPLDLRVPTTEVLLRTYQAMRYGRITRRT